MAPAGNAWVESFSELHRHVRSLPDKRSPEAPAIGGPVSYFTDTNAMGADTEITLLAVWNEESSESGIGGIVRTASLCGVKVHKIPVPKVNGQVGAPAGHGSHGQATHSAETGTGSGPPPGSRPEPVLARAGKASNAA